MRSLSPNHYECAFENWLIDHHIPYVRSDEHQRLGPSDRSVKNFDFLLRLQSGRKVIVEVKGRTFSGASLAELSGLECWVTLDDIEGLQVWQKALGSDHEAVFVFAYRVVQADVDFDGHESLTLGADRYVFFCIRLADYLRCMKNRSRRWRTVALCGHGFPPVCRWSRSLPVVGADNCPKDGVSCNRVVLTRTYSAEWHCCHEEKQHDDEGSDEADVVGIAIAEGGGGVTSGSAALTWLGANAASYQTTYDLKSTHQADPWASLINVCNVLNNTALAELPDKLEAVLNVDGALWLCAFEIVFEDDDGYVNKRGSDYGLYYEPETGRIHLIQYDGNESMGTSQWPLFYRADDSAVPIMYRLMAIPKYRQRYLSHVRTILNDLFTEDVLFAKIEAYRSLIDVEVQADTKKLYNYQAFTSGITALKSFITGRRTTLLANAEVNRRSPEITAVEQETIETEPGRSLLVTARLSDAVGVAGVELYVAAGPFALFTPISMADQGVQTDDRASERVFIAVLPDYPAGTVVRYYVQATAADGVGTLAFNPEGAEHEVYSHLVTYPQAACSGVVLNEVMAKNVAVIADSQGEYDDWIELKNVTGQTISLAGMYLSDSADNPLKWGFPEGTEIGAGEYLLVWADEDTEDQPGLHANFKLSAQGETIWLFDTIENRHALLDSVTIEGMSGDQSWGRYPDGAGLMQVSSVPTPWEANAEPMVVEEN